MNDLFLIALVLMPLPYWLFKVGRALERIADALEVGTRTRKMR